MNYIRLPYLDTPVSIFAICQAHAQLEADYNVGGIARERLSNRRRNMSTGCQLSRMGYASPFRWVDILSTECNDPDDDAIRDIYLLNVLRWGLPINDGMREFMRNRYAPEFLNSFSAWGEK